MRPPIVPGVIASALDRLLAASLVDEEGEAVETTLRPGMSEAEIEEAEGALGHLYLPEVRRLLARTRGVEGLLAEIDFAGLIDGQALDELFPRVATIAADGLGNAWVVDLLRENGGWGPIWFLSHDPPVALHQCGGLATFLDELVLLHTPPHASLIADVPEDRLFRVGREHPGAIDAEEALGGGDDELASFARSLGPGWTIVDARDATPGLGIAWGRFGPRTELRRHGASQLFACRPPEPRGLFRRRRR